MSASNYFAHAFDRHIGAAKTAKTTRNSKSHSRQILLMNGIVAALKMKQGSYFNYTRRQKEDDPTRETKKCIGMEYNLENAKH